MKYFDDLICCKGYFSLLICNELSCNDQGNQLIIITNTMNIIKILQLSNFNVFLHDSFLQWRFKWTNLNFFDFLIAFVQNIKIGIVHRGIKLRLSHEQIIFVSKSKYESFPWSQFNSIEFSVDFLFELIEFNLKNGFF